MKQVYLVTSGSYSDYGVDAIFSTEKLANEWILFNKGVSSKDYHVSEIILDPVNDVSKGFPFTILMDKQGNTYYIWDGGLKYFVPNLIERDYYHTHNEEDEEIQVLRFTLYADNQEQAIKIVNEKRLQLIAGELWDEYFKEKI